MAIGAYDGQMVPGSCLLPGTRYSRGGGVRANAKGAPLSVVFVAAILSSPVIALVSRYLALPEQRYRLCASFRVCTRPFWIFRSREGLISRSVVSWDRRFSVTWRSLLDFDYWKRILGMHRGDGKTGQWVLKRSLFLSVINGDKGGLRV